MITIEKKHNYQVIISLLAAVLILAAGVGCGGLATGIVAQVYGQPITEDVWQKRVDMLARSRGAPVETMTEEARNSIRKTAANQLVMEKIVQRQGEERGLTASDQEVQARVDQMAELRYAGDREALLADLEAQGSSESELFEGIRVQLTQQKLFDDVARSVEASDDEAYQTFQGVIASYMSPEFRRFRMLVVADSALATELRRKIDAGEDFASLVVKYTTDEQSKGTQGEESMQKGQRNERIPAAVAEAAFSLPVNEVAGPIETDRGFYIVKLLYVEPDKNTPFEQVKEQFRENSRSRKVQVAWQEFLKQAEKDAGVIYRGDVDPGAESK